MSIVPASRLAPLDLIGRSESLLRDRRDELLPLAASWGDAASSIGTAARHEGGSQPSILFRRSEPSLDRLPTLLLLGADEGDEWGIDADAIEAMMRAVRGDSKSGSLDLLRQLEVDLRNLLPTSWQPKGRILTPDHSETPALPHFHPGSRIVEIGTEAVWALGLERQLRNGRLSPAARTRPAHRPTHSPRPRPVAPPPSLRVRILAGARACRRRSARWTRVRLGAAASRVRRDFSEKRLAPAREGAAAGLRWLISSSQELRRGAVRLLRSMVPQIDGDEHQSLVERVHGASVWNFDFVALVCLSTLIASLGLVRDAGSVVIGAMLVAPLMTPLVAMGLALARGDLQLFRNASRSALLGFALVFGIGLVLGVFLPGLVITGEMSSRGSPNVLDLLVAFVTGMAAAYASARPNLLAVLPGAAIAAAVVPPIATCGMSLAIGRPIVAIGAATLFAANVVAIVLGSAVCLRVVGICNAFRQRGPEPWVGRVVLGLVLTATILTIPLSYLLYASLPSNDVPDEVIEAMEERIARSPRAERVLVERTNRESPVEIRVVIASPSLPAPSLANDLAAIAVEHYQTAVRVSVITRLITRGDSGELPG